MIQVKKLLENKYIFELQSESGHTLFKSVSFTDKKNALASAHDLSKQVKKTSNFERKTNHTGEFLFNFKNSQGSLIGSSPLYNSEAGMENGIKNLKKRITTISRLDGL